MSVSYPWHNSYFDDFFKDNNEIDNILECKPYVYDNVTMRVISLKKSYGTLIQYFALTQFFEYT